jgi:hypothetical protein
MRDHRDNIMTALLEYLDELDRLVRTARTTGMPSEDFISGLRDAIGKVKPVGKFNQDFWDADFILAESLVAYEKHPTPEGIGKIGNALVGYRRTATS